MERPDLCDYKDEIHHPNGCIEDIWRHGDYVESLEGYTDFLENFIEYASNEGNEYLEFYGLKGLFELYKQTRWKI